MARHPEALEGGWMDVRPSRGLPEAGFRELGAPPSLRLVTGDEALGALLREAGARLVLRTLAMRGSLEPTAAER